MTTAFDHQTYWQQYTQQHQRLSFILPKADYATLLQDLNLKQPKPHQVCQLILAQAAAYRQKKYLPPTELEPRIEALIRANRDLLQVLRQPSPAPTDLAAKVTAFDTQLQNLIASRPDH